MTAAVTRHPTDPAHLPADGPNLLELAGGDRIARELLEYACEVQAPGRHVAWTHVLAHVPEGARGAVDNFLHLLEYLRQAQHPELDVQTKVKLGIVEVLWRLRHDGSPCLTCVALADSIDDIRPCDGLLCTVHRGLPA